MVVILVPGLRQLTGSPEVLGKTPVRFAITVCERAEESCPSVWPFTALRLFWPFEDPAVFEGTESEQLERFRAVRNEIDERIVRWLKETPDFDREGDAER